VFSHLDDWLAPRLAGGARDVRGELYEPSRCLWEPVGTPDEYLAANLQPLSLSYLDADARARAAGARLEPGLVIGAGARLGRDVALERAVVWDGESVPDGLHASDGVFAGGRFHPVSGGAS
jgi:NDP-sugar pyrophosphorylase family protein